MSWGSSGAGDPTGCHAGGSAGRSNICSIQCEARPWSREAENLHQKTEKALTREGETQARNYADLNAALLTIERELLLEDGIPGRPWFKHALYAPRYTYAAMSLPGVREAAEAGDWDLARSQLEALLGRLRAVTAATRKAAALVPAQ